MFFLLSKILRILLSPVFWMVVFAIIIILSKNKRRKKRTTFVLILTLFFFTNPFIADEFMRAWETKAVHQNNLKTYDVGILLTGMCTYDKQFDRINFDNSSDRILQCMDLYHKGFIKKIFISGGSGKVREPEFLEAKLLHDYLVSNGIPDEDVDFEIVSRNTHENAVESARILKPETSNQSFLLITSAFHMKRSIMCFNKQGFKCDYYSTNRYAGNRKFHIEHLIVPKLSALNYWEILLKEWVGIIMYKIKNYV